MAAYGIKEELTANNWDYYDDVVREAYRANPNWHLDLLTTKCNYKTSVLDAYWEPGSDNDHPDVFRPSFRIDAFLFASSPSEFDYLNSNAFITFGWKGGTIYDYLDFVSSRIKKEIEGGAVALKNALAYDRGLDYSLPTVEQASRLFTSKNPTTDDILHFQDYLFHFIADIAKDQNVPIQCHTGMGTLDKSRAIHMLSFLRSHPDTRFSLMHASFPWTADIISLLDMFPNVYADICWLPLLSPTEAEYTLHQLIEAGTSDRIVWGCDTSTGEESLGARLLVNHTLASVLSKKVENGYFSYGDAVCLGKKILYANGLNLFCL